MAEKKEKRRQPEQLQKENSFTGNRGSIEGTDKMGAFVDVYHPQKQYGLIYIDPPWEQARGGRKRVRPNSSGRGMDYPVMPLEKIIQFHKTVLPLLAKERHNHNKIILQRQSV